MASLNAIAKSSSPRGQGILAADESEGTIAKRFALIGLPVTLETRQRLSRDAVPLHRRDDRLHLRRHPHRGDAEQKAKDGTPFRRPVRAQPT